MSIFLQITVGAYKSVKNIADKQEWRAKFEGEFVSVHLPFTWQSTAHHLK
jgi:hypothetical protein